MLALTAKRTIKQFIVVPAVFIITHKSAPCKHQVDVSTFDKAKHIEIPKEYQALLIRTCCSIR
jgi:hypothetical protein